MSVFLKMPHEVAKQLAQQAQEKRLSFNLTQKTLSMRAGVSFGVLKKFERTGKISLESFLKIALVLGDLETCAKLFTANNNALSVENMRRYITALDKNTSGTLAYSSLDQLMKSNKRRRGRQ